MSKEEDHKEEVDKLNILEDKLLGMILDTGNDELLDLFQDWTGQRTKCNEIYVEFLDELLTPTNDKG